MPQPEAEKIHDKPQSMGGDVSWTRAGDRADEDFHGNAEALRRDLAKRVDGEVRFDSAAKATYSTDASNYRQVPLGVVLPKTTEALAEAVAVCHRHGAPVTNRGCGTSLAGQSCNEAVIIDSSKHLDQILEVNPEEQYARVEVGVRRDQLTNQTEAKHNLTFAPDTSTHEYATFGGMIGNNSCGMHSQMARRTQDNVEEMEILLYDGTRMTVGPTSEDELEDIIAAGGRKGEVYAMLKEIRDEYADEIRARYPEIPRRVSGYNLTELLPERGFNVARALVGTEGTCATVLEAKVTLVDSPPGRALLVLGFDDIYDAGDHVTEIGEMGPVAIEGFDHQLIERVEGKGFHPEYLDDFPEGFGYLIAEFGGATREEAAGNARAAMQQVQEEEGWGAVQGTEVIEDPTAQEHIWAIREAGLAVTAHRDGNTEAWPGWEDSAVPPSALGDYMRDLRGLYDKHGYDAALYGHFGQACVHTRIPFDLQTPSGLEDYRQFVDEASDLCMRYGGSFSAEHGDGQARAELLPKMFGEELIEAFRKFKAAFDPGGKMNPGKVVDPYPMTDNLRLGTDYHPGMWETNFAFPEDEGGFSHAALRCVGVGKCRKHEVDSDTVMCPSFLATHEEEHTTRGRSRLLFEMMNGEETPDMWNNDDVFEALDLCLACKGCKSDCPVGVDMATYKAEFLSHYYKHPSNPRPRSAYAFGLIYWWARLASWVPKLANLFTQTVGLDAISKKIAGVAQERHVPPFAEETFRAWFKKRDGVRQDGNAWISRLDDGRPTTNDEGQETNNQQPKTDNQVVLFPDTFNNHFKPETLRAATFVLEDAGWSVVVPRQSLCCGRPLYDYGFLDAAKGLWKEMLGALRPHYRAGTPIVGLEPSCVAGFRDELPNLFPHDADAKRLTQNVFTLAEFLTDEVDDYEPPRLEGQEALVHGHCHHKSIMGADSEKQLLEDVGLEFDDFVPASCCGMAGAFGFEEEHYDVSIAAGEHALLPAVREADSDTLLVTDGFSCREQIQQTTDRRASHLAEVLHRAMRDERDQQDASARRREVRTRETGGWSVWGRLLEGAGGGGWAAAGALAGAATMAYLAIR